MWVSSPTGEAHFGEHASFHATSLSLNTHYRLLAIGTSIGDVVVFRILDDLSIVHSHTCLRDPNSPSGRSESPTSTISATRLLWSPDGACLAVGYKQGGVALWSVFGSLLLSSYHDGLSGRFSESILVRTMSWGPQGYYLIALPFTCAPGHTSEPGDIIQIQFAKSSLVRNATLNNQNHVILQSHDRIYVNPALGPTERISANLDKLCDLQWQAAPIPVAYLGHNSPLYIVAADATCSSIAIAGKRGLIIYFI